jgi:hypothetical protein
MNLSSVAESASPGQSVRLPARALLYQPDAGRSRAVFAAAGQAGGEVGVGQFRCLD